MLIRRFCPPRIVTWPTPSSRSSARCTLISATSVTSRTGVPAGASTASTATGAESGSALAICGLRAPVGSCDTMALTRCSTSCAARLGSFSSVNWAITRDAPSVEIDDSSSSPATVLTAASILSVMSVSTDAGAAPGWMVVMVTSGKSTLGNLSTPRPA